MRPLRLSMRGLRSYRGECTIDFSDRGLIAIVGDTGAGKSSILEAITYALYNATTWDQRAVGQLISDGVQSMSVELEFQAGDHVWSVNRACHRAVGRPSTRRLRCLSDPTVGDHDGEAAVNRQVERLLGMSYHAYKAAVVLPQGRFQTLLQETPAKRTGILEGIFRLTDLRGVQTAARGLADRVGIAVRQLTATREALLPDPAGTKAALEGELESLRRRESMLIELQAETIKTREATKEARERADVLREHARLVTRPDGQVAHRLAELLPLATAIDKELDEASAAEAEATQRVEQAASAAAAAAEAGESIEDLAAAAELLMSVRQALTDLEAADLAADQEQSELDAASLALRADEAALPELETASRAAGEAASTAAASLERQRELGRQVREALRAARESAAACDTAAAEEPRRREAMAGLEKELAERRRLAHEAESALDARRSTLEEAQRHDAAAHAAEGLSPGDPCPVCGRRLAEDFQPPSPGALQPLRRALKDADAELTRFRAAETTAATQLDEGGRRLAEAMNRRKAIESTAQARLQGLHLVAPAADLGLDDAVVLRPIDDRAHEFEAKAAGTGRAAELARGRLLAAQADLEARRPDLGRRVSRLERERERVRDQRARCEQRLRTLPRAVAVEKVAGAIDLDEAIAATGKRLDEAKRQRMELDDLRAQVVRMAKVRSGLQRRLQDEVERPRGLAMRSAMQLWLRINDGLRAMGRPSAEVAPSDAIIEVEVRWTAELERTAAELQRRLDEAIAECDRASAKATAELDHRLAESGLAGADGLDEELRLVSRELGRIQSGIEIAEAQIPRAADLDGWIKTGVEVRDSLSELARFLQDAQFIGHVIERRQRQLLIVASQILGSMTGDAYGFASDFEIVDRSTNQPRPTRTLSGGETFLASLALALALVEIAARSGTQLDALFLDEGFGSLDADALDDALSALELQASGGRLVAVVSHVRAVAERIETVLEVTRSAAGSRAEWRGSAERELMLSEELEAKLLA